MPTGGLAQIWAKLLPLGLTKKVVRKRLRLNNYQMQHVWKWPGEVLTLRQLQELHGLVATYYTMPELAQLLANDGFRPASPLNALIKEVVTILSTNEGQKEWDAFISGKRAGQTTKQMKARKEKKRVSREVFTRISDELATDEVLHEFSIEHRRLSELKERTEQSKDSDPSSDVSGPVVSI